MSEYFPRFNLVVLFVARSAAALLAINANISALHMQWCDEYLDGPLGEQENKRDPPTSTPRREENTRGIDIGRNGDYVGAAGCAPPGSSSGVYMSPGEMNLPGADEVGGDGGLGDHGVLRVLEKILAKHSTKHRRRPSTAVRRAHHTYAKPTPFQGKNNSRP